MTTYYNPAVKAGKAIPIKAGCLTVNRDQFDIAGSYKPASVVSTDKIQIGVVPAGCKLVPHLSSVRVPILDTNGSPTGSASFGTATTATAMKATTVVSSAQVLTGEDWTQATSDIGAKNADVPIYMVFTANVATLQTTGTIISDLVIRPYDSGVDTDVT